MYQTIWCILFFIFFMLLLIILLFMLLIKREKTAGCPHAGRHQLSVLPRKLDKGTRRGARELGSGLVRLTPPYTPGIPIYLKCSGRAMCFSLTAELRFFYALWGFFAQGQLGVFNFQQENLIKLPAEMSHGSWYFLSRASVDLCLYKLPPAPSRPEVRPHTPSVSSYP